MYCDILLLQLGPIFYSMMHFSIDITIINVVEPSCTSTSVQISWTTTANCITNYIINSTTSDNPTTTTTSDTSYTLPVSSLGEGVHYFSVAGVDTGGRTGPYSNTVSVTISGKYIIVYHVY